MLSLNTNTFATRLKTTILRKQSNLEKKSLHFSGPAARNVKKNTVVTYAYVQSTLIKILASVGPSALVLHNIKIDRVIPG